ncbi:KEOPS complex Cgi121-like subunit [Halolamina pelagica]|uniref:KEOPS complex Cgi121-like subunit n=1 Tax=Halolamina pelagica TaxID=699431 RepID=A0A0P7HUE4_9EURY|nr:KEOPS complex subunit Cgi121 [Halolamina pelagica]KPN30276.1 KEOPS complex Cgi121-like subunit [Halolamina pelagica]
MRLLDGRATVDDLDAFLATLDDVAEATGTTVQAFDADYVVSAAHLQRALDRADRAIARGENIARERAVELLCYAAGRRQINRALEMGVGEGANRVVVLVDSPAGDEAAEAEAVERLREHVTEASVLGEHDEATVRTFFDVSDAELDAVEGDLTELVLERVALLDVEK